MLERYFLLHKKTTSWSNAKKILLYSGGISVSLANLHIHLPFCAMPTKIVVQSILLLSLHTHTLKLFLVRIPFCCGSLCTQQTKKPVLREHSTARKLMGIKIKWSAQVIQYTANLGLNFNLLHAKLVA